MNWIQTLTIIGSMIGLFFGINSYFFGPLNHRLDEQNTRIEAQCERLDRNLEAQSARSDKLYEMFIDLLKERK